MAEAKINSEMTSVVPAWQRVPELADLVEIFDPGVQICSWLRRLDPAIQSYLSQLHQVGELQVLETLSPGAKPKLDSLPKGLGRASLVDDIAELGEILCELLGCGAVGLRLARVKRAMCPGWHIDRTGLRLVCTYQGPGTQWLDDQGCYHRDLHSDLMEEKAYNQALPGELVLLKGSLWQDNEAYGSIHRSPELELPQSVRTLITLDPLWSE